MRQKSGPRTILYGSTNYLVPKTLKEVQMTTEITHFDLQPATPTIPTIPTILTTDDRLAEDRPEDHQDEIPQVEDRLKDPLEIRIHGFHAFQGGALLIRLEALLRGHLLLTLRLRLRLLRTITEITTTSNSIKESRSRTYLRGTATAKLFWNGSINSIISPIEAMPYSPI
jgi:hypothetical protein